MTTTALQTREDSPVFSLVPTTLKEAMDLAKLMADSDLVPPAYKGKPGNVLIAVQMGAEVGLSPMVSVQNIAVINNRPSLWGDAGKALLISHGCIIEETNAEQIRTTGVARCKITRPGRPPVERTFSREDAKQAGLLSKDGPWKAYPERMMSWRAFWFAARDGAADILKGLHGAEEVTDYAPMKEMGAVEEVGGNAATRAAAALSGTPAPQPQAPAGPTLDAVLKQIRAAQTPDDMTKASEAVTTIANADDKATAREAYRTRLRELKAAAAGPTFAELADKLKAAQSVAEVDVVRDLIRSVKADDQREELSELANRRAEELNPA